MSLEEGNDLDNQEVSGYVEQTPYQKKQGFKVTAKHILLIWRWVYATDELTSTQKLITIALADSIRTDLTMTSKVSNNEISKKSNITSKTVANNLKQLIKSGHIEKIKPRVYKINYEEIDEKGIGINQIINIVNASRNVFKYCEETDKKIKPNALLVMLVIINHCKKKDGGFICYPKYKTIRKKAKVSRNTVSESITALKELGMLNWVHTKREDKRNSVNTYVVAQSLVQGYPQKEKKQEPVMPKPKLVPPVEKKTTIQKAKKHSINPVEEEPTLILPKKFQQ